MRAPSLFLVAGGLALAADSPALGRTGYVQQGPRLPGESARAPRTDPVAALDRAVSAAEANLRQNQIAAAESRYREALGQGWLLLGALYWAEGRLPEARNAFRQSAAAGGDTSRALRSLALVHLQMREAREAVAVLAPLVERDGKDLASRRLLAQSLVADGRPEEAVRELEQARKLSPEDLELAFALAGGYLRVKKVAAAEPLFAEILAARPIPQTHVLIGQTYVGAGEYERGRKELRAALAQDPRVRRAHYYLGMSVILAEGTGRMDAAIPEFREELKLAPEDVLTHLNLGAALAETRQYAEALPHLERASRSEPPRADAFSYLGRSYLALDRAADAASALTRALELAKAQGATEAQLSSVHYQLGVGLRTLGRAEEAAPHFEAARRYLADRADDSRERMARYLADIPDPNAGPAAVASMIEAPQLGEVSAADRAALRGRVSSTLARASSNLGVIEARAQRFDEAAEHFESALALDPELPQVQYALGVARFNGGQFDKATEPLTRALVTRKDDADLRRMLAMAWVNTGGYDKAAELLRDDPQRERDPSLQYAYGMALVRSDRAAEAEPLFARLLAEHADWPELSVLLGQAHAQQGDYPSAIESLTRALGLKADVADANATLGVIYLKQGRLPEAEAALRGAVKSYPADTKSQLNLAIVLEAEQRPDDALPILGNLVTANGQLSDARYLLGKILLAQGKASEALAHLETASRLAPEDPNVRYQLGQAYQKLGQAERAQEQFELFRQLKEKRRGSGP